MLSRVDDYTPVRARLQSALTSAVMLKLMLVGSRAMNSSLITFVMVRARARARARARVRFRVRVRGSG